MNHLDSVYFNQQSTPGLDPGGRREQSAAISQRPTHWQITLTVPGEAEDDPARGPSSRRHKPVDGGEEAPPAFRLGGPHVSLQWQAFQRVIGLLRGRGNDVLVVVGPFNEHMIVPEQRPAFRGLATASRPGLPPTMLLTSSLRPCLATSTPTRATRSPMVTSGWPTRFAATRRFKTGWRSDLGLPAYLTGGKQCPRNPKQRRSKPIYQLKITLSSIKPPVWRRVQVEDCTLAEFTTSFRRALEVGAAAISHAFDVGGEEFLAIRKWVTVETSAIRTP